MGLTDQILWGTLFLTLCCVVHVGVLAAAVELLRRAGSRDPGEPTALQTLGLVGLATFSTVVAHMIQVCIWSVVWVASSILLDWNSAIYFSLVTYTTLGYGDIILGPGLRIFASFAAITGLLTFGLSTAFLVGLMSVLLRRSSH